LTWVQQISIICRRRIFWANAHNRILYHAGIGRVLAGYHRVNQNGSISGSGFKTKFRFL